MSTNWLGRLCGTIWTGVCERLAGCHWQISKMLCNLLLAPILSSSVGGVGFTPRCYAMNKAFVIFLAAEFYPQPSSAGLIVNILIFPAAVSVPTVFKRGGQMEMDSSIFSVCTYMQSARLYTTVVLFLVCTYLAFCTNLLMVVGDVSEVQFSASFALITVRT